MKPTLAAVPATVEESAPPTVPALAASLRAWMDVAALHFRAMGHVLRAIVLATLCPDPVNVFLIGLPGTAKSAVLRAWAMATAGVGSFLDVQFSPWSDVAELFGAVDIQALQAGRLERSTTGRTVLQTATFANFDELPRGSPGLRAATLRPMAERELPTGERIPTHVITATANTRLTSEEDQALVDRFALRVEVNPVEHPDDVDAVLFRKITVQGRSTPTAAPLPTLSPGIVSALRAHAATVEMPIDVAVALRTLYLALRQPAPSGASYPYVSPRRWVIITSLLQASATLAGRSVVDWTDLTATLPMCLDDGPENRAAIGNAITAAIPRWVRDLSDLESACNAAIDRARRVGGVVDVRPGDADGHTKRDAELDALVTPLRSYGASVVKSAEEIRERADIAIDTAYTEAKAAYAAQRKAQK